MENISRNNRFPDQDFNLGPLEYEPVVPTTRLLYSPFNFCCQHLYVRTFLNQN
jgi:hypothetical protein